MRLTTIAIGGGPCGPLRCADRGMAQRSRFWIRRKLFARQSFVHRSHDRRIELRVCSPTVLGEFRMPTLRPAIWRPISVKSAPAALAS